MRTLAKVLSTRVFTPGLFYLRSTSVSTHFFGGTAWLCNCNFCKEMGAAHASGE